jgi:hypothetical protein
MRDFITNTLEKIKGLKPDARARRELDSIEWFKNAMKRSNSIEDIKYFKPIGYTIIGRMFMYRYDPKLKDTLTVWDEYPLVIPFRIERDGWYGINLHFLPIEYRVALIGALLTHTAKQRAKINFDGIVALIKRGKLDGAIKHYLASHVKSRLITVDARYWRNAVHLPLQKFHYNKVA